MGSVEVTEAIRGITRAKTPEEVHPKLQDRFKLVQDWCEQQNELVYPEIDWKTVSNARCTGQMAGFRIIPWR